ncbi:MAG: ABC transporter substrate-binding protein, partial [Candidatus Hadarchaeum sp.]|uniref:ABC transporter substrate-binding protein n=1 Tax=Candidatus Hadarchaeum sp. TaxID=2883567 RepID=UPI00316AFCE3
MWKLIALILSLGVAGLGLAQERGGVLTIASYGEPVGLIPFVETDGASHTVSLQIYEPLFVVDEFLRVVPWLVESYEVSADATVYTLHLKHNIKWHDGERFTAEDVTKTLQLIMDPAVGAKISGYFTNVMNLDLLDQYTLRITLRDPDVFFPTKLADIACILPKHIIENQGLEYLRANPIGTGPFKFVKWEPGQYIELIANPEYWKGCPYIDKIIVKFIPDATVRTLMLLTGEAELVAWGVSYSLVPLLEGNPNVKIITLPPMNFEELGLSHKNPILQDKRVRQAIYWALDRDIIRKSVFRGYVVECNGPIPVAMVDYYNPNIPVYTRDIQRAVALLQEAGWVDSDGDGIRDKNGQPLQFSLMVRAGQTERMAVAEIIQSQLKDVGIKIIIEPLEWGAFLSKLWVADYDLEIVSWSVGPDPSQQVLHFSCNGGFNVY